MRKFILPAVLSGIVVLSGYMPASASPLKGPHEVLIYNHRTYIAVPFYEDGNSITYRFYRARGPRWQKWGSATVGKDQKRPGGSVREQILFKSYVSRISYVDLSDKSNLFFGGRRG